MIVFALEARHPFTSSHNVTHTLHRNWRAQKLVHAAPLLHQIGRHLLGIFPNADHSLQAIWRAQRPSRFGHCLVSLRTIFLASSFMISLVDICLATCSTIFSWSLCCFAVTWTSHGGFGQNKTSLLYSELIRTDTKSHFLTLPKLVHELWFSLAHFHITPCGSKGFTSSIKLFMRHLLVEVVRVTSWPMIISHRPEPQSGCSEFDKPMRSIELENNMFGAVMTLKDESFAVNCQ